MPSIVKTISKNQKKNIFWSILHSILHLFHNIAIRTVPSKTYLKYLYKYNMGKKLDIENPKSMSEKIQWMKLHDKNPLYITCTDKYAVRDYIKKKIGEKYLIPLLFQTDNINELKTLDFSSLPKQFVVKANHGSGWNIIVDGKRKIDSKYREEIINTCKVWLKTNYYYIEREWQYKYIKPRIIIEKYMQDDKGNVPKDFKFYCFGGEVGFIQVDSDRFGNHKRSLYDENWHTSPFEMGPEMETQPVGEKQPAIPKPTNLKELLKVAHTLSKDFNFVRVDLYSVNNRIYFGELTFTPAGGYSYFIPDKQDTIFGNKIKLNIKNKK